MSRYDAAKRVHDGSRAWQGESRRTGHNWSGMSCKAQIAAFHIFQSTLVVRVVLVLVVQVVHSQ